MTELIFEVVEDPSCGYRADAIGVPIHTFGESLEELRGNVQEAVDCYFTGEEGPRPPMVRKLI